MNERTVFLILLVSALLFVGGNFGLHLAKKIPSAFGSQSGSDKSGRFDFGQGPAARIGKRLAKYASSMAALC